MMYAVLITCATTYIVIGEETINDDDRQDSHDTKEHIDREHQEHDFYEVRPWYQDTEHETHFERPGHLRTYHDLVPRHIMNDTIARTLFMCQMKALKHSAVARSMRLNIPREGKFLILQSTSWGEENVKIKMSSAYVFNRRAWAYFHKHVFRIRKMDPIFKNKYMAKPYVMRDELKHQLRYARKSSQSTFLPNISPKYYFLYNIMSRRATP